MDRLSRSRGWDKEIPHGVLPMKQLVLSVKWVRKPLPSKSAQLQRRDRILKVCM